MEGDELIKLRAERLTRGYRVLPQRTRQQRRLALERRQEERRQRIDAACAAVTFAITAPLREVQAYGRRSWAAVADPMVPLAVRVQLPMLMGVALFFYSSLVRDSLAMSGEALGHLTKRLSRLLAS
jgi:hypothetical protein